MEEVTFRVDADRATFKTEFNGTASGLFQLQVGIETALAFLTRFGVGSPEKSITIMDSLLSSAKCAANVKDPEAGSIISSCFSPKNILDAFGAKAVFLAVFMVAGPIIAFFEGAFSAVPDIIKGRDIYRIKIEPAHTKSLISCQLVLSAISNMTQREKAKLGALSGAAVGPALNEPQGLRFAGVPRDSGSGDAYDYRWSPIRFELRRAD